MPHRSRGSSHPTLASIGERGLLERLKPFLLRQTEQLLLPTGDDVAITKPISDRIAWTTDAMIEGTHFDWYDHPLATVEAVARKLVVSNVSDLASKGAEPLYALLCFGVPGDTEVAVVDRFFASLEDTCREFGLRLIGGDMVRAPIWTLTLTVVGKIPDEIPIAARRNALPGMNVYLTGYPGESGAGFRLLQTKTTHPEGAARLINRHLSPSCSPEFGRDICARLAPLAMIDTSDGLAKDAGEIARQSDVAIILEEDKIPVSAELLAAADVLGVEPIELCLYGGEDYDLLFCTSAPERNVNSLFHGRTITRVGTVEIGEGVKLKTKAGTLVDLDTRGYLHY